MAKATKMRASKQEYVSQNQLKFPGFETPFEQNLNSKNRWCIMSNHIPWDKIVKVYHKNGSNYGASKINGRIAIGSLIIKYICDLSDRDVLLSIQENIYMQYFLGLSSFCTEQLYDPSLLTEIRKRLSEKDMNQINEIVVKYWRSDNEKDEESNHRLENSRGEQIIENEGKEEDQSEEEQKVEIKSGSLLIDATVCPQDIQYPTDIRILSECREKLESIIDKLHEESQEVSKPRTYREIARENYLQIAQAKRPSKKKIRNGIKQQLQYVNRDLKHIDKYLKSQLGSSLTKQDKEYLKTIRKTYDQQMEMYTENKHSVENRIVSIHQPHVRPIVRGKRSANVEFGAKIQVAYSKGMCYVDYLSWDAFNEGQLLKDSVKKYKERNGYYPQDVLADKIYCTRENRAWLKEKGIILRAKPLGRPSALSNQVSPGERNPIEGKFGVGKSAYGLQRIKARLATTSASWISGIFLVLNLVKLAGISAYCLVFSFFMQIMSSDKNRWHLSRL